MPTEHEVRAMMLALPEAHEVVVANWGDQPTFRVRNKMFGLVGYGAPTVCLKATLETQTALVQEDPEVFLVAPFFGRYGWIDVVLEAVTTTELAELVEEAWRLSAPKRVVAAYDGERGATPPS
ncbi:MmcQ/YjbR family DNA-binding protein [Rhodococcus tibetensis]|uniref:MmcQ/YjbR family DNA-binding protein n=1 Tax=Rhodococcus tibetensis TaxID=2965064 RepID=A0ABT1QFT0_9NOCA|nr:MmcQ/YjbR family DNA-binding protein [Rhodococcus sp. FXJ9.536]MCQ4121141.1 MmcQ/YjbR family DNA-binding protein [Rhodococcus sp. FXJ9.536]